MPTFDECAAVGKDAANFTVVSVDRDRQCRYRVAGELTRRGLTASGELRPRRSPRRTEPLGGSSDRRAFGVGGQ